MTARGFRVICGKGKAVATVVHLPVGKTLTIRTAADVFLDSLGNPKTIRTYGIGAGKTAMAARRGSSTGLRRRR